MSATARTALLLTAVTVGACSSAEPAPPISGSGGSGGSTSSGSGGSVATGSGGRSGTGGTSTSGSGGTGMTASTGGAPGSGGTTPGGSGGVSGTGGSAGSTGTDAAIGGDAKVDVATETGVPPVVGSSEPCNTMPAMTPPALKRTLIGNVPNQAGQIVAVPGQATFYVISHRSGDTYVFVDGKTPGVKLAGATVSVALGAGNEQGLLSMAFHPDFAKNKLFYLYYTAAGGGNMTIDEFELLTPTTAMKKQNIWNKPRTANQDPYHNGGTIYFNPKDGVASPILYFAVGNNNSGDAANPNGTTGRVLAIDTVTKAATSHSYGLRNPYRMSIDRLTGDMWIGDVANGPGGAVYFQPFGMKGKNWGYGNGGPEVGGGSITGRDSGSAAMIGGIVYRGNKIPGLCGRYFYGLWSSGAIKSLIQQNGMRIGAATHADISVGSLTSFGEDGEGEMILGVQGGQVYRVEKAN